MRKSEKCEIKIM